MKPEIKAKWVEALRSGEYKQGKHKLAGDDLTEFCCLGVLCDIVKEDMGLDWELERIIPNNEASDVHNHFDGHYDLPSPEVAGFCGLSGSNPTVRVYRSDLDMHMDMDLSELNDSGQYTFEQIADIIEEQL